MVIYYTTTVCWNALYSYHISVREKMWIKPWEAHPLSPTLVKRAASVLHICNDRNSMVNGRHYKGQSCLQGRHRFIFFIFIYLTSFFVHVPCNQGLNCKCTLGLRLCHSCLPISLVLMKNHTEWCFKASCRKYYSYKDMSRSYSAKQQRIFGYTVND